MQNYSITALDYYLPIPVVLTLRAALELENVNEKILFSIHVAKYVSPLTHTNTHTFSILH